MVTIYGALVMIKIMIIVQIKHPVDLLINIINDNL